MRKAPRKGYRFVWQRCCSQPVWLGAAQRKKRYPFRGAFRIAIYFFLFHFFLYQKKAVSRLFYSLPIHGYAAINMNAIATLNDEVGGVDITVLEDMTSESPRLAEGERVHLEGADALTYVRYRDTDAFASADRRLERQKQYLTEFVKAARSTVQQDLSSVVRLYQALSPMMVTDISADEAVYLASQALDYKIDTENFYMLKGETVMGEQFEEYNIDEEALYELILQIFYEPVS